MFEISTRARNVNDSTTLSDYIIKNAIVHVVYISDDSSLNHSTCLRPR